MNLRQILFGRIEVETLPIPTPQYDLTPFTLEEKLAILKAYKAENLTLAAAMGLEILPAHYAHEGIAAQIADELSHSPEEWTGLTGVKMGMQPFEYHHYHR